MSNGIASPSIGMDPNFWSMVLSVILVPLAIPGIGGNVLIVLVRARKSFRPSINILMIALAIGDILVWIFFMLVVVPRGIYDFYRWESFLSYFDISERVFVILALFFHTVTIYFLVLITIERFIAVCFPLKSIGWCTTQKSVSSIVIIVIFSFLFNLPVAFEPMLNAMKAEQPEIYDYFLDIYQLWSYTIVIFAIPLAIMALLSLAIVRRLRKAAQLRQLLAPNEPKPDNSTTIMLLLVVLFFLFCNTLNYILRSSQRKVIRDVSALSDFFNMCLSYNSTGPMGNNSDVFVSCNENWDNNYDLWLYYDSVKMPQNRFFWTLSGFLNLVNASVNFPIYYFFSAEFRKGLSKLWRKSNPALRFSNATTEYQRATQV